VVIPLATVAELGVIVMAVNAGAVTDKFTELDMMPLAEAVIAVVPCAKVDAMPLPFKEATVALLDAHATDPEILPVLPSEYVPVAVNVIGEPLATEAADDVMLMPVNTAVVIVKLADDEVILPKLAVTVVLPTATPVASPVAAPILAIPLLADVQFT
jgi:hypothetical protein